jgi:hypothetical protein
VVGILQLTILLETGIIFINIYNMYMKGWKENMNNGEEWRLRVEEAKAHPRL